MRDVDLQSCVGRTFEKNGQLCRVEFADDGVDGVGISWSEVAGGWQSFDVPEAMLKAWIAGAMEVNDEK